MTSHKITKREARTILRNCRSNQDWSPEESLNRLNNDRCSELPLLSGAKIVGKDRHYYLLGYAGDASDISLPLALIGRPVRKE